MKAGALIWILEEDDVYGAKYLRGVFSSENDMIAWVSKNVHGPVSALHARQTVVDRPDRGSPERKFQKVNGIVSLVEAQ